MIVQHDKKYWTREDQAKLEALMAEGKSEKEMARELGRTESAVDNRVKKTKKGVVFNYREPPKPKKKRPPIELFSPIYTEAL